MEKTPKPKSNRAAIVEAALSAFIANGFHQTGIRDIAKRAGVSLGNLYNHFAGKDALIQEIARIEAQEIEEMIDALPKHTAALDAICAFAQALLEQHSVPENAVLAADLTSEALRNPKVAEVFAANGARIENELARLMQRGIEGDELHPPIPIKDCVALLRDTALSTGMRVAFEGAESRNAAISAQDVMIRRLLA